MNIYLISQDVNNDYDTYDSAVVVAETAEDARMMHPGGYEWDGKQERYDTWADVKYIKVEEIGTANSKYDKPQVICASFNAG